MTLQQKIFFFIALPNFAFAPLGFFLPTPIALVWPISMSIFTYAAIEKVTRGYDIQNKDIKDLK